MMKIIAGIFVCMIGMATVAHAEDVKVEPGDWVRGGVACKNNEAGANALNTLFTVAQEDWARARDVYTDIKIKMPGLCSDVPMNMMTVVTYIIRDGIDADGDHMVIFSSQLVKNYNLLGWSVNIVTKAQDAGKE